MATKTKTKATQAKPAAKPKPAKRRFVVTLDGQATEGESNRSLMDFIRSAIIRASQATSGPGVVALDEQTCRVKRLVD